MVTGIDIASTLPFIVACVFGTLVLMLEAFQRPSFSRGYIAYVAAFGFLATGFVAVNLPDLGVQSTFGGMAYYDGFTTAMTVLFCVGGFFTALMSPVYLASHGVDRGEYYALLLFAAAGMMLMVGAGDLMVFFVALEIQSVAIYGLAAYLRRSPRSAEAGMKYFLMGAFATGIMLYGMALVYGATGTTQLEGIAQVLSGAVMSAEGLSTVTQQALLSAASGFDPATPVALHNVGNMAGHVPLLAIGVVLIVVGFSVKVAAVPFHMWAPDVYTGSPTPIVGFMAASVKAAGFAALVRVLVVALFDGDLRMGATGWTQIVFWISLASMVLGNFVALAQTNVKRMLAYSSVAHAGYLMIAICAMGYSGVVDHASGIVLYAAAYTFGTVGAFGALAYVGKRGGEAETYDDLNGLGFKMPWLGAALAVFMLSSAGIPPSAGFIGKFELFRSAVDAGAQGAAAGIPGSHMMFALVVMGILTSVAGVYYYLRVLVHLYMKEPVREVEALPHQGAKLAILGCALLTLWFGVFPGKLVTFADDAVENMGGQPLVVVPFGEP
jgi:NADH-quinone oxidoreductase subunit N